ncbi:MAG: signal peptidase I [Microbacteriaceae bacterium]
MTNPLLKSVLAFLKDLVIIVGSALLISFLIKTFLFRSFYIPSASMEDTLLVNDRIIVNELVPDVFPLQRGDVVVFADPGGWLSMAPKAEPDLFTQAVDTVFTVLGLGGSDSEEHLVKRLIGLPGDHVMCCSPDGLVEVNGVPVEEPYVKLPSADSASSGMSFDITVPKDRLWVMGDNRYNSADSRYNQDQPGKGFVPIDKVVGRAIVISWPFARWTWIDNFTANFANAD